MNRFYFTLLILMTVMVLESSAQIVIRETNVIEKAIIKPQRFDSLTNISRQKNIIDYNKYIGYKMFYLPRSKKHIAQNKDTRIINFLYSQDTTVLRKSGKIPFEDIAINRNWLDTYGSNEKEIKRKALKNTAYLATQGRIGQGAKQLLEKYNSMLKDYEALDVEKTKVYKPIFYHVSTNEFTGEIKGEVGTSVDSVEGKYFTIVDIKAKVSKQKVFKKLEDVASNQGSSWAELSITLKNESNNDTLYWLTSSRNIGKPFILVPYFEKMRNIYLNKKIKLKDKNSTTTALLNMVDVNTGQKVSISYGEVWECSDVSFVDLEDSYYLAAHCFLRNGSSEVKVSLESGVLERYFILEEDFIAQEKERQMQEEQRKLEAIERQKKLEKEQLAHRKYCIEKWGNKMGGYIAEGKVVLGMNKDMCLESWGKPINKNANLIAGSSHEQWMYDWNTFLYFENGILTAIQN